MAVVLEVFDSTGALVDRRTVAAPDDVQRDALATAIANLQAIANSAGDLSVTTLSNAVRLLAKAELRLIELAAQRGTGT
jgi:hypothetical protein